MSLAGHWVEERGGRREGEGKKVLLRPLSCLDLGRPCPGIRVFHFNDKLSNFFAQLIWPAVRYFKH